MQPSPLHPIAPIVGTCSYRHQAGIQGAGNVSLSRRQDTDAATSAAAGAGTPEPWRPGTEGPLTRHQGSTRCARAPDALLHTVMHALGRRRSGSLDGGDGPHADLAVSVAGVQGGAVRRPGQGHAVGDGGLLLELLVPLGAQVVNHALAAGAQAVGGGRGWVCRPATPA